MVGRFQEQFPSQPVLPTPKFSDSASLPPPPTLPEPETVADWNWTLSQPHSPLLHILRPLLLLLLPLSCLQEEEEDRSVKVTSSLSQLNRFG